MEWSRTWELCLNGVELVTKRKTGLIKGFKGKNGKAFDASLVLDEQFNVGFSFPEKKAKPKK